MVEEWVKRIQEKIEKLYENGTLDRFAWNRKKEITRWKLKYDIE